MKIPAKAILSFLLCGVLRAGPLAACGGESVWPAYWPELDSGYLYEARLAGEVGIVDGERRLEVLYVAWRHLEGLGFPRALWPALQSRWELDRLRQDQLWEGPQHWIGAVEAAGFEKSERPETHFSAEVPGRGWQFFPNCLADSFKTAASVLAQRAGRWGKGSRELAEWLHGQQQVFSNCGQIGETPTELDESWPADLRADRQYQIAAADFYALRYDEAGARFARIAADGSSPWAGTAALMAVRVALRQERHAEAEKAAAAVLADRKLVGLHPSARRLAEHASIYSRPAERAQELERELTAASPSYTPQKLHDLWYLARTMENGTALGSLGSFLRLADSADYLPAVEAWKKDPRPARLVLALMTLTERLEREKGAQPTATEDPLLEAAAALDPLSGAYLSARYYRARLLIAKREHDQAKQELDALLASSRGLLPDLHRLRYWRAHLTRDWDELLRFGKVRRLGDYYDGDLMPEGIEPDFDPSALPGEDVYDFVAEAITHYATLDELAELTESRHLGSAFRARLARLGFVRAALQDLRKPAESFAAKIAALDPSATPDLQRYLAGNTPGKRHLLVDMLLLGDAEFVLDLEGERAWCWRQARRHAPPSFLAEREVVPAAGAYGEMSQTLELGREVLAYAQAFPNDEDVPEALHLTVRASRWGCRAEGLGELSKKAFDLLHKRYSKSPFTAATPYWFE